ncbi:MAG: radical SAM protein [Bacteroidales bacterium]|nr:radical SAM protein [Bacteroidales bacterium]
MLRFDDIVFGPIRSRRLGASLGINLLPRTGKLCNFDCIYCECGWNSDGRGDAVLPSLDQIRTSFEARLEKCRKDGVKIDSFTFSGHGEPTLHPDFPAVVDMALELRDRYYPDAVVSVLSNATMLSRPEVFEALRKVDNPILKLDAPFTDAASFINRPACTYSVEKVARHLERFGGEFILQTMFLRCPGFDSADAVQLDAWKKLVRRLRPRKVMVYTIDRETPDKSLGKIPADEMKLLVSELVTEGFDIEITE